MNVFRACSREVSSCFCAASALAIATKTSKSVELTVNCSINLDGRFLKVLGSLSGAGGASGISVRGGGSINGAEIIVGVIESSLNVLLPAESVVHGRRLDGLAYGAAWRDVYVEAGELRSFTSGGSSREIGGIERIYC